MRRSLPSAAAAVATMLLAGCLAEPGHGPFGPASGLGAFEADRPPALVLKASPTRGESPVDVAFAMDVRGDAAAGGWSLDFGDGSIPLTGTGFPAAANHTYLTPGSYVAAFRMDNSALSTLSIVVLPRWPTSSATATIGPEPAPPGYAAHRSATSSSGPTSSPGTPTEGPEAPAPNGTSNSTTITTTSHGTDGTTSTSSATSGSPTPSTTPSTSSGTSTTAGTDSSTPTSSETTSTSETGTSTGESPSPTESPTATESPTPTSDPTPTGSPTPTADPTPTESATPTDSPSPSDSPSSSSSETVSPP